MSVTSGATAPAPPNLLMLNTCSIIYYFITKEKVPRSSIMQKKSTDSKGENKRKKSSATPLKRGKVNFSMM